MRGTGRGVGKERPGGRNRRRRERVAAGLCSECGDPISEESRAYCDRHLRQAREYALRYKSRRAEEERARGRAEAAVEATKPVDVDAIRALLADRAASRYCPRCGSRRGATKCLTCGYVFVFGEVQHDAG